MVGDDFVGAGAAAVLANDHRAAEAGALAEFSQVDHRVGVGQQVAFVQRPLDQAVQRRLVRRVQQQAADPTRVVGVRGDASALPAVVLAEQVPGNPLGVFPQDLVVDVLEQLDLHRVAGPIDRLDAVDDHPADAADEVAIEKSDGGGEPACQFGLPVVPCLEIQVAPGDAAATGVEHVEIVARPAAFAEEARQVDPPVGGGRSSQPNIRRA